MNVMKVMLDPERYGYQVCPHCNGYGSSLKESASTCTHCGGVGLVKQQKGRCICGELRPCPHMDEEEK